MSTYTNLLLEECRSAEESRNWDNFFHLFVHAWRFQVPEEFLNILRARVAQNCDPNWLPVYEMEKYARRWSEHYPDELRYQVLACLRDAGEVAGLWFAPDFFEFIVSYRPDLEFRERIMRDCKWFYLLFKEHPDPLWHEILYESRHCRPAFLDNNEKSFKKLFNDYVAYWRSPDKDEKTNKRLTARYTKFCGRLCEFYEHY